jgi:hypothetical protein
MEGVPQRLKPDSLQSIYVRPEGRTLQKLHAAFLTEGRTLQKLHAAFLTESRTRGRRGVPHCRRSGYASVGMTILLPGNGPKRSAEWLLIAPAELSSRPERSAVEGPAVSLPVRTQTPKSPGFCLCQSPSQSVPAPDFLAAASISPGERVFKPAEWFTLPMTEH